MNEREEGKRMMVNTLIWHAYKASSFEMIAIIIHLEWLQPGLIWNNTIYRSFEMIVNTHRLKLLQHDLIWNGYNSRSFDMISNISLRRGISAYEWRVRSPGRCTRMTFEIVGQRLRM